MNTNIFSKLFLEYSNITESTSNLSKLGEKFAFYSGDEYSYADENQIGLFVYDVIEIDIKSAFPTICNVWFDKDSDFIQELNSIEDKLQKNIFMTNYLVRLGKSNNHNYLIDLNNNTKLVIFSKIYNEYENVNIFEYKKDSLLFRGDKIITKSKIIEKLLVESKFNFHYNEYKVYIRFNRSSIYLTKNNEIIIKGKWKDSPEFLCNIIKNYLLDIKINEEEILKIYSNFTYELLKDTKEFDLYYKFGLKYKNPTEILNEFLIPLIYLIKINK